jgi:hypothetical protein
MSAPAVAIGRHISDLRIDARTEEELFWRWHYADGELSGLQSNWSDSRWAQRTPGEEMRCGPVYVPSGQRGYPAYEMDLSGMRAYHRVQRIDWALSRTDAQAVAILRRAFHDRAQEDVMHLCPIRSRGPALCNLVELTAVADREWRASRTARPLHAWLARLSAKCAAGSGDAGLRRTLTTAADLLLASAGREYAGWRRR